MEKKPKASSNILIVDDEIGPRESLRMILKTDYNVHCVDSGSAAIEMVQQNQIDVVTLDLKMPGLSGMDTLEQIRAIDPTVMVIIVTGSGTLNSAIEAMRHGVFDYIPKPFNVPEVMAIIQRAIQRRRLNVKIQEVMSDSFDQYMVRKTAAGSNCLIENGVPAIGDSAEQSRSALFC
jgi:DNA-binding NtrC family response regulator